MAEPVRGREPVPDREPIHGHIVLTSLESLSVRTLEELERIGERVVIVAQGGDTRNRDAVSKVPALVHIVEGDRRDPDVLRAAGIEHAKALVLAEADDVGNLHAALSARHINPSLHVVIRTFDEELGRRIESAMSDVVTLSASAIAAPGFVSAVLDESAEERTLVVLGRTLALRHTRPDDPSVLLALADDEGEPVRLFPGETSSDREFLCLVDPLGATPASTEIQAPPRRIRRPTAPRRRARWLDPRRLDSRFWVLGGVLAIITVLSALVLGAATRMNLLEAIYDVVGAFFGGIDPGIVNTDALRMFAIILTLVGAAALALFYGVIADVVLSTRLTNVLGPRPEDAHEHVIVVGLGTIGFRIASQLRDRGIEVVGAERTADSPYVEAARSLHIAVVTTDVRSPHALKRLNIDRARAIVCATDDDAANLTTAFHARALRPDIRIVIRLFDPDLAARLDRALGDYHSRSVSSLAAPAFAAAAVGREVLATIPVGQQRVLVIARVPIEAASKAEGATLADEEREASAMLRGGLRVLGVVDGETIRWRAPTDEPLVAGSELLVVATKRGLATGLRRGARPGAEGSSGIELAHHQEVGEPESVEGSPLGAVEAAP